MRGALEEERHLDGNHQSVPLAVRQLKIPQKHDSARDALVLCATLSLKKNSARVARTYQLAVRGLDQVLVFGSELAATHFASLRCRPLAGKLAKGGKCAFLLRGKRRRHVNLRSVELVQRTK